MSKFKRWDIVEIEWEDSYQLHGWTTLEESGYWDDISLGHTSIGYYIGETKKQISICQSRKTDPELIKSEITNVNALFHIPKSCIKRVKKIEAQA